GTTDHAVSAALIAAKPVLIKTPSAMRAFFIYSLPESFSNAYSFLWHSTQTSAFKASKIQGQMRKGAMALRPLVMFSDRTLEPRVPADEKKQASRVKFCSLRTITILKAIKPQAKYLTLTFLLKDIHHGSH
ncbi:hypothetical protein, partial [Pantoea ananatis]|uniref:hypothetical protein n=2 Tax=Pantoea TaxID=53335 RepID=UPI0024B6ED78